MSTKKNYSASELTTEVLLNEFPTASERAFAIMRALPVFFEQVRSGIRDARIANTRALLEPNTKSRANLLTVNGALRADDKKLVQFTMLIKEGVEEIMTELRTAEENMINRLRSVATNTGKLEVLEHHEKEFYEEFIKIITPFVEKEPKLASYMKPENKPLVLANGADATIIMLKYAGRDRVPQWIKDYYSVGFDQTNFQEPPAAKQEQKVESAKEEQKVDPTAIVAEIVKEANEKPNPPN
jgi:hypothetical protein